MARTALVSCAMTIKSIAEELALIAQEIGAEVMRGAVRYELQEGGLPAKIA